MNLGSESRPFLLDKGERDGDTGAGTTNGNWILTEGNVFLQLSW